MQTPIISIVAPVYGCKTCLWELYFRIEKSLKEISENWELILVNDASPDGAWETIIEIAGKDTRVKGIDLSRNFGQHYAITAGLDHAKGDWVVVMDCDLQDQPEEITKLYSNAQEGFDIVLARRENRQDGYLKKLGSRLFYKTLAYLTDTEQNAEVANFGIYKKSVIEAILNMNDRIKYFPAMVKWVGFKSASISVQHAFRTEGKSSYSFKQLMKLGINTILSFSDKPLKLTIHLGLWISLSSFIAAIITIFRAFYHEISVVGYSSLIVSIWFLSGIIITLLGMLGLYIGKIFDQVKTRPVFILREKINI